MSNKPTLLILSDNRDFIEPLSSLVTRELGLICKTIASEAEIKGQGAALLITERVLADEQDIPVVIAKLPIRIRDLLDNIEAFMADKDVVDVLDIGSGLQFSLQNKSITDNSGVVATLTDKESQLLLIIANAGENVVSREVLLKEVWKIDTDLDTHTLETHIYRLRKKIKDAFGDEMIKAIEGGYKL